jgi:hypothetical protein
MLARQVRLIDRADSITGFEVIDSTFFWDSRSQE